ncbi:MAG: hypothetical protein WBM56_06690, partial [Robiginitalea sp.]|uniref:hypothetical protein n=1 Tax=Robiginitalea sp. TaxID=1902411 RepID=UPI003C746EEE
SVALYATNRSSRGSDSFNSLTRGCSGGPEDGLESGKGVTYRIIAFRYIYGRDLKTLQGVVIKGASALP